MTRSSAAGTACVVVAALALAALGARGAPDQPRSPPPVSGAELGMRGYPFSHAAHAARDQASTCVDCHDLEHTQASGAPSLRRTHCAMCHDDAVPALAARAPVPGARAALAVRFDHAPHAAAVAGACAQCHAREAPVPGQERTSHVEHSLIATSAVCFACHNDAARNDDGKAPQERACSACHGRDERSFQPATHGETWRRGHGTSIVPFAPQDHGQSCTLCHRESSCTSCHRVERPADHGPVWGERLHGITASFDSARCKTCHETGQCVGCHRTTEPKNHVGAWKSTHGLVARSQSDTTCQTCHRPSFCIDCHRGRK